MRIFIKIDETFELFIQTKGFFFINPYMNKKNTVKLTYEIFG